MRTAVRRVLLMSALMSPGVLQALGLGDIRLSSALNQPFDAEIELIAQVVKAGKDAAVGIIDVKSYYIETAQDVADRVRLCLKHAPPDRLSFAPDCGLSQTARWAARQKLVNMVAGVKRVREELKV